MLGIPRSQCNQIDRSYLGGIGRFIQDRIEAVFRDIPLRDNYFWRVHLTGESTLEFFLEYLKPNNFQKLKVGLVDRVTSHTDTVARFLSKHQGRVSEFVLLDHKHWLYDRHPDLLAAEYHQPSDASVKSVVAECCFGSQLCRLIENSNGRQAGERRRAFALRYQACV